MTALSRRPLQVYLQPDQERILRTLAEREHVSLAELIRRSEREHVSLAELIRRSIDGYLAQVLPPNEDPSLGLIGLGRSGRPDLAARHDEILAGRG